MTTYTITGIVTYTKRVGTSVNGNPTYEVEIRDDHAAIGEAYSLHSTMSDSMLAYAIDNPEYRNEPHVFTLTRAGRIRSAMTVAKYLATTSGADSSARAYHSATVNATA